MSEYKKPAINVPDDYEHRKAHYHLVRSEQQAPRLTLAQCESLFLYLAHGDDNHKHWLRTAIKCWALGWDRPIEIKENTDRTLWE